MIDTYVIGHQQPDTDTIVSAIGYATLQNAMGNNIAPARCGELNPETQFVLDRFDVEVPEVLDDAAGKQIVLVDHNEYAQTAKGMRDAEVIGVVDHHRLGDVETSEPIQCRIEPVGSTATILADMYAEHDVAIPDDVAGLLLSGLLSDTVVLRSPTTTDADRRVAERLSDQIGLDYEQYGKELLAQKSKLGEKSPREMVLGDFKEFDFGIGTVGIGQVETVTPGQVLDQTDAVLDAMEEVVAERDYGFLLLLVTDLLEEESTALFVGDGAQTFEEVMGTELTDRTAYLPGVMSRKKQVVPPLEDAFSQD